jgi:hypothetical protein
MRLEAEHPGRFGDGQLRTLQRRVKEWRRSAVQRLVFPGSDLQGSCEGTAATTSPVGGAWIATWPAPTRVAFSRVSPPTS